VTVTSRIPPLFARTGSYKIQSEVETLQTIRLSVWLEIA